MKNILIVEDSRLFAGLISKKISKDFSFHCVVKSTYSEAIAAIDKAPEPFFLAILDLNLPDAPDGEIVSYVTSKKIPVIVMTSHVNDDVRDKIFTLKVFDYILKGPQSLEVLSNTIHRYSRNINFQVLLVDDSNFARFETKNFLTSQYFHVIEVNNGFDALKCLDENPSIKLMITDYHMPKMDGTELVKQVREKFSMQELAIIGISARGNPLLASQFLKCGANDFISKPYFEEELIWRVNQNVELLDYMAEKHLYQMKLEQEVKAQTAKIKKSQNVIYQQEKMASIGQLAAGVAHEINNPTGFISSNLGTLKKYISKFVDYIKALDENDNLEEIKQLRKKLKMDFIVEDSQNLINESIEGTDRIRGIVKNLKSFSRVDEEKIMEADINECIENTLKVIWNELKYKAKITKEYSKLPPFMCYPQQLSQVFMNLLVNAAHAIDKEGEIIIKTWVYADKILISISDTGQGIPAENIDKLFDAFFTTKEVGKGTGLGLSIAHEIIKKHKGKINVISEVGIGTTFTLEFPTA